MPEVIITESDFDCQICYQQLRLKAPKAGAIVTFVGLVRDYARSGEEVVAIELQQYEGMTASLIESILTQAKRRWQLEAVQLVHRIGHLSAGQQIVCIATAAAHRHQAFQACEFIMDYLKTKAPLWKKEFRRQPHSNTLTEEWLETEEQDWERHQQWQLPYAER